MMRPKRALIALVLFGAAFGYVEAAVVSYLRKLYEPVQQKVHPGRAPGELFPLLTQEQIQQAAPDTLRVLTAEIAREAATLVMLAAVALAIAENAAQWAAAFAVAFGVWDIAFYLGMKLLLDWPASLLTWDILFLVPVPWVGPVLAPALVAACMIAAGTWHLVREGQGQPIHLGLAHWLGLLAGAAVITVAFAWDYRRIMAGGMPESFSWPVFGAGLAIGLASFIHATRGKAAAHSLSRAAR